MLIPYRSESDPEVQGEGSIDPLGLATVADHLADWILPGITARMWRPRFLTAMVVASAVVEPYELKLPFLLLSGPALLSSNLLWVYTKSPSPP